MSAALMSAGMYLFSTLDDGGGFAGNSPIFSSQLYLMIMALGFGGVVATLSVAVQNAVPYRDVGVATAALQFCRSLGGMTDLAITGVVMVQRFRSGVEAMVPDDLDAALPTQILASVKNDPQALLDPHHCPGVARSPRRDRRRRRCPGPGIRRRALRLGR